MKKMKVLNFRDISECSANRIKKNTIFRSAQPDKLKSKDLHYFHIKTIIDLREPVERKKVKNFKDINTINLTINFNQRIREKIKPIINKKNVEEQIDSIMSYEYLNLIESEKEVVKQVFELLIDEKNYPILIHCKAGKDRTGFIVALIQLVLGFREDEIIEDYLLSNKYFLPKIKKVLTMLKIFSFGVINTKNYKCLLTSHKKNIYNVIETIKKHYDTIDKYLESCGVNKEDFMKIQRILLNSYS